MAEKITLGLSLTVMGMSIVFFILCLLMVMMHVEALVVNRSTASKKPVELPAGKPTELRPEAEAPPQAPVSTLSPQVVAAIMGAIALCTGQPVHRFRLISVRQAKDLEASAAWTLNNRMDVINRRNSYYAKGGTK
ncbi:MAG TPA: OadG family protein [Clostridia bacterium]|nr:OadG family protein [Clostridia bacterium]